MEWVGKRSEYEKSLPVRSFLIHYAFVRWSEMEAGKKSKPLTQEEVDNLQTSPERAEAMVASLAEAFAKDKDGIKKLAEEKREIVKTIQGLI